MKLLFSCFYLGVLPAETFHAPSGIHQLLLTGEERMAVRADFHRDVALMGRAGHKCIAARAVHAHFVVRRMNRCFHISSPQKLCDLDSNHLILQDLLWIQQPASGP